MNQQTLEQASPVRMTADEQARRTYEAWKLGVIAPHSSVYYEGWWCNFWTSPGLWTDDGMPSRSMTLTAELNRRGLNR